MPFIIGSEAGQQTLLNQFAKRHIRAVPEVLCLVLHSGWEQLYKDTLFI